MNSAISMNRLRRKQPSSEKETGRKGVNAPGISRRSFLQQGIAVGTGAAAVGVLPSRVEARGGLTPGDAAILRFLAAAEILETDAWQQYNELAGIQDSEVPGGSGNAAFTTALEVLDSDMAQYVHDNTEDEYTHFEFINAYLVAHGAAPANLEPFRNLPSSTANGAQQIGRLTNLMQLRVDTTWWTRYRSGSKNPEFGDTLPQAVPGLVQGEFPGIPRSNADLVPGDHLQAIANTAGFHFAMIEQGGTSLYPSLAQRVTHTEVLRILLSIGPTEAMHFQTWQDKAGNAPPLTDPTEHSFLPLLGPDLLQVRSNSPGKPVKECAETFRRKDRTVTEVEAIRQCGDAYNRTRLTPAVRKWMGRWLAWQRSSAELRSIAKTPGEQVDCACELASGHRRTLL